MKIVILGDTHMPKMGKKFPERLRKELDNADLILHTGDWQTIDVVENLSVYAPIKGVVGNVDGEDIQKRFPEKLIVELPSLRIGLTHGHGRGKTTEKRAMDTFKDEPIDLLIFGHSHIPIHRKVGDLTIFNPGSPTDKRRQPHYSFGLLKSSNNSEWVLEHVLYDDKN
ncbi:metallophosphoesterase family protein [Chungangia koreensis]|uniref:Phosphoesterase n=1 Tax=Chungangia koreensis TaxID=752657 RepID=A0ABV8X4T1_9LACT